MTELNSSTFSEKANGATPIIVDFWADWCMPCKVFAPVLQELSADYEGKVEFCKVNVDNNNDLAVDYSIASIPTVVMIKEGEEVARIVGVQPKEKVKELIDEHL